MTLFPDILKMWTIPHSLGGVLVNMTSKTDHKVKKSGRTKWIQSFLIFRPRLPRKVLISYFRFMFCSWGDEFPLFSSTPITRRKTLSRLHGSTQVLQKKSRAPPQKWEIGKDPRISFYGKRRLSSLPEPVRGPTYTSFFSSFFSRTQIKHYPALNNFFLFLALFHKNTFLLKKISVLRSSCPYVFFLA